MAAGARAVGVLTTDRDLVVRSWDAWLTEATGVSPEAACGRALAGLFPEIGERGLVARLQRVVAEGVVEVLAPAFHHYLVPAPPSAPSEHFARMQQSVTISPLRAEGEITGTVITIEDVTARMERERRLAAQLRSEDEAIRLRAARALAEEEASPDLLVRAFADPSWRVRQTAAEGVSRQQGEEVVTTLTRVLREQHHDPSVLNATLSALISSGEDLVPPLLELLQSPDQDLRIYVALALGHLGDPRAVPALLDALSDADPNVRYHALEALGRLGASAAVPAILAVAESGDFFLSFAALEALISIGEASVSSHLIPLLRDDALLPAVVDALGQLGDEDAAVALASLLSRPDVPTASIAVAIADLHGRFEDSYGEGELIADLARSAIATEGVQQLVGVLGSASDRELAALVRVLGWLDFDGVERLLIRLLSHPAVRGQVIAALVRKGTRASEALVQELNTLESEATKAAVSALGQIGSPEAVPALTELLQGNSEVAVVAAGALGSIGDPRAFEPLLRLLGHPEAVVRHAAVGALNSIGHPAMPARVRALLADPSPQVRESAARIAGYFGYDECLEPILGLCSDPEESVRRAAIEHLPYFEDVRSRGALASALGDPSPPVRAAAARALVHLPTPEARPQLRLALQDPDFWVRYYAARSAAPHAAAELRARLADLAASDPMIPVRIAAAEALGQMRAAEAIPVLARLAEDPQAELACAALAALGQMGDPAARAPLLASLRAEDPRRRIRAVEGLRHHASPRVVEEVAGVVQHASGPAVIRAAVDALSRMGTPEAIAALCDLAADRARRPACVAALSRVEEGCLERVGDGLRHPDAGVRAAVVEALARTKHRSASRVLAAALEDPSESVRVTAEKALGRMGLRQVESRPAGATRQGGTHAARRAARDPFAR